MKKFLLVVGIISLCLAFACGCAIGVLSVKKGYAEDHYKRSYKEEAQYGNSPVSGRFYAGTLKGYGCGNEDCKYCDGIKFASGNWSFIYYRTIRGLFVTSIVLTAVFSAIASVTLTFHFRCERTRRSDREDY